MPLATYGEAFKEYARNAGEEKPDTEWILTPWDTWERNPWYHGKPGRHPEEDYPDPVDRWEGWPEPPMKRERMNE